MTHARANALRSAVAASALALAGCSGGMGGVGNVGSITPAAAVPYQRSNAIMKSGYSETQLAPDRYRIEVVGPLNTPRERLELIAAARAAEIGRDNRLGYFKIEGFEHNTKCESYIAGGQRGGSGAEKRRQGYAILNANVAYTKAPSDQSYQESKPSFEQYRSQLDLPQPPGLPADPTAQCG